MRRERTDTTPTRTQPHSRPHRTLSIILSIMLTIGAACSSTRPVTQARQLPSSLLERQSVHMGQRVCCVRADRRPTPRPTRSRASRPTRDYDRHDYRRVTGDGVWVRLAKCESSTGRDSSNGQYHGYLQWLQATWDTVAKRTGRMDLYHHDPHLYDFSTHMMMGKSLIGPKIHANPYGQWPVCWPRAISG